MKLWRCLLLMLSMIFHLGIVMSQTTILVVTEDNTSSITEHFIYEISLESGCEVTEITRINVAGAGLSEAERITDIALAADGTIYVTTIESPEIYAVNPDNGEMSFLAEVPLANPNSFNGYLNALTASSDGFLYTCSKAGEFFSINISNSNVTSLGNIPQGSNGDLTFNQGSLYLASDDNKLIKVNINDPGNSTVIGNFSGTTIFDLVSFFSTCGSTVTYGISNRSIYTVDINTAQTRFSCTPDFGGNQTIFGATSINEFNASECNLVCDMNGSTTGSNGNVKYDCNSELVRIIDPALAEITSTSEITEIVLTLSGIQDGTNETLEFSGGPPGGISPVPTSGTTLTFSTIADAADYVNVLGSVFYKNDLDDPTPGTRTISIQIENADGETDNMCSIEIDINCNLAILNIDLDELTAGNNYAEDYDCNSEEFLIAPNPIFSPTIIDEFVIEITNGLLDVGRERIEVNPGNLTLSRDSDTKVILTNNLGAAATPRDFTDALASARYINTAVPKSQGDRIITVTGFLDGSPAATLAQATVSLNGPDAGKFDPLFICRTSNAVSLFDAQSPGFVPDNETGTWTLGINGSPLNSGSDIFNPAIDASGTYVYTLLNACNIRDTAGLNVTVENPATFDAIPDEAFFCTGSNIVLNAATPGAASYKWSLDRGSNNVVNNGSSYTIALPGLYYVTVDLNGCILVDSTNVFENPVGELDVKIVNPDSSVFVLCDDQSVSLTANTINPPSNDAIVYKWSTGSNETTITVDDKGIYSVTAKQGCDEGSDDIRIELENCRCPVFVPNAFSPLSAASINSSFYPITDSCATMIESNLSIFNRWGEKIHEGGENNPWRGGDFPLDTYAWHFTYSYRSPIDENQVIAEELKGFVILVR